MYIDIYICSYSNVIGLNLVFSRRKMNFVNNIFSIKL